MWRTLIYLLLLTASIILGLEIIRHPGYLLIVYQPWMIQMPVWLAIMAAFLVLFIFYILITSLDQCQFWWLKFKNWLYWRKEFKTFSKTQQGLAALLEGQWKRAERLLMAHIHLAAEPLLNYLGAAKAAHALKAYDRRDRYIHRAYEAVPHAHVAIGITQAELEVEEGQYEQALATLKITQQHAMYHPRVLMMLEKIYLYLGDWQSLKALLPSLYKAKVLTGEHYNAAEKRIYQGLLSTGYHTTVELQKDWQNLPRYLRRDSDMVYTYVQELQKLGGFDVAKCEELIRGILNQHYHAGLVTLYGNLPLQPQNRQLATASAWLDNYGEQPALLLALAKICVKAKLWGKAKDYFAKSLQLEANLAGALAYGELLESLGDEKAALAAYRVGLSRIITNESKQLAQLSRPLTKLC